jgi:hypothetical protein
MVKTFSLVLLVALIGCSGLAQREHASSPCDVNQAGYDCQFEQYHRAP